MTIMGTVALIGLPLSVHGTSIDNATAIESSTTKAGAISQQKINESDTQAQQMKAEIAQLQAEVDNLTVYRDHLQRLVDDQNREADNLKMQLSEIGQTRAGLVPLMYRMLDGLDTWISNDLPLKEKTRQERLAGLQTLMGRADVSDAEKIRQILEAYQIEVHYGANLGLYQDTLDFGQGPRVVDILHLGRVSLVARSLDGNTFWFFDRNTNNWEPLDPEQNPTLERAFLVAKERVTPELLTLPLSTTLNVEASQ
ncbi:hypothetical protein ATN88_19990 [Enterovibrio coralii]|uniref:Uncharacterized protein n=1 Tax=Enterovibrio coralii TaxID=294935 RepID=A0A135I9I3_9GAMM|nr:hypothetical protein ATN88_19990 [Enterovibrio coralii]